MKEEKFSLSSGAQKILFLFILFGAIALAAAFYLDPVRAWSNILLNNFYFVSLGLGSVFFIAIYYVSHASWATGLRRIPEAMSAYLPVSAFLMLILYFGLRALFHWAHPETVAADLVLRHKQFYLNEPFFMVRVVFFFVIWIWFSRRIAKNSYDQDLSGAMDFTLQNRKFSALFLVVFALTFTLASYDWMMSLEPHWFSTIFSVYTFAGLFLHSVGMITLIVLILLANGYLKEVVNENHLHDLGKLIFAFSTFWAYCWFCQYMLIWYVNIPEETAYFFHRHEGRWFTIFIVNLFLNWLVPFFLLLPRGAKRSRVMLWIVSIELLAAHWLDLYLMVFPSTKQYPTFGHIEYFVALGFLALFFWVVFKTLEKRSLVPVKDPYLKEGLKLHQ